MSDATRHPAPDPSRKRETPPRLRRLAAPVALIASITMLAACGGTDGGTEASASTTAGSTESTESTEPTTPDTVTNGSATVDSTAPGATVIDDSSVHEVGVTFDQSDYEAMIAAYRADGSKEWIPATVTIDGETYEDAGMRLKGNSSIMGLRGGPGDGGGADDIATSPESLPWLIRLDEYVAGQNHDGLTELVIRSNRTETSLNEAVALELLELGGLASQDAMATGFSVNGSEPVLRLAIENPAEEWLAKWLGGAGSLYKAESTGDYGYRGDDAAAYDEVFDLEAGDDTDLTHLTDFLEFINEADDETFASELGEHLDVEAFATYLAMMELVDNFDDIDGPGNNSYLHYDPETGLMTVVPWDMNLAFGGMGSGEPGSFRFERPDGAGTEPPGGMMPPENVPSTGGLQPPGPADGPQPADGFVPPSGPGSGPGGSNILVERFNEVDEFAAMVAGAKARLQADLFDTGEAQDVLDRWVAVLTEEATSLVTADVIAEDAATIAEALAS